MGVTPPILSCMRVDPSSETTFVINHSPRFGAASHKGYRHRINQDAICLTHTDSGHRVVSLADGVSSAVHSETTARQVVFAATQALAARLETGPTSNAQSNTLAGDASTMQETTTIDSLGEDSNHQSGTASSTRIEQDGDVIEYLDDELTRNNDMAEAFAAAQHAFSQLGAVDQHGACTLISAHVKDNECVIGWLGDCRAYLVTESGSATQLTTDDSVAQLRVALGVPREVAEQGAQAHAITRWLGHDSDNLQPHVLKLNHAPDSGTQKGPEDQESPEDQEGPESRKSSTSPVEPAGGGQETPVTWLLLCSDGLWNYASDPSHMNRIVQEALAQSSTAAQACEHLVNFALGEGGQDNVTVALIALGNPS